MSTIAIVQRIDTWEQQRKPVEVAKFIDKQLTTFNGSYGYGGIPANDQIQAAKDFIIGTNNHPDYRILVIDTQSPEWSNTHQRALYPEYFSETDDRIIFK